MDDFQDFINIVRAVRTIADLYRFLKTEGPEIRDQLQKSTYRLMQALPHPIQKRRMEKARLQSINLLGDLSARAMDEHSDRCRHPWGTVPKPGPGLPVGMSCVQLETLEFKAPKSVWEQLAKIGSEDVEAVWNWVENREGLKHPLSPFLSIAGPTLTTESR